MSIGTDAPTDFEDHCWRDLFPSDVLEVFSHQVSLFDLHHKYADVMTLAELTGHLS